MMRGLLWVPALLLVGSFFVGTLLPAAFADDNISVISDEADLSNWKVAAEGGTLTYDTESKSPASLSLNKLALTRPNLTIELEGVTGDLLVQSGTRRMQIETGRGDHVITLDRLLVYVDDKAESADSRSWRRLLDDEKVATVTLEFDEGSKPIVHIIRAKAPADRDSPDRDSYESDADAPQVSPADDNPLALSKHDAMLLQARNAVIELQISTGKPGIHVVSSAIMLSEDGFAITQFHPLRNTTKATAVVPGITEPVDVQLWAVEPSLDLALIKLPSNSHSRSGKLHVLPLAEKGPKTGDAVWVLGVSYDGRATINIGNIDALYSHTRLSAEQRRALPFEHVSQWVVTTAPITVTDSGGPLINLKGELVAMAVWTWPSTATPQRSGRDSRRRTAPEKKYLALSGNHIKAMLDKRPDSPVTFARAKGQYALTPVPHTRLPRVKLTSHTTPALLRRSANTFAESAVCPMCDGIGQVELEREPRDRQAERNAGRDPAQIDAEQANQEPLVEDCPRCKTMGFERPDALLRLGNNVVEALSTTDRAHPLLQREYVNVHMKIKESLHTNPVRLAEPLNTEARKHLRRNLPDIGTPILFIGATEEVEELENHPGRPLLMSLGDAEPRVIVHNNVVYDHNLKGVVLVGGLLAGFITDDNGELVPVVEGGFAVNIPENEADEQENAKLNDEQRRQQQLQSARERYRRWIQRQRERDNWQYQRQRGRTPQFGR